MSTLRQWFEQFTESTGEPLVDIVFSKGLWDSDPDIDWDEFPAFADCDMKAGRVRKVSRLGPVLDVAFDDGWGGENCPPFYAWSENWVAFKGTYDGSEWLAKLPRNPTPCMPDSVGGG